MANKDTTKEFVHAFTEETLSSAPASFTTVGSNNAWVVSNTIAWYGIGTGAYSLKGTGQGSIAHDWGYFATNLTNSDGYVSVLVNFDDYNGDRAGLVFRAHDDSGTDKCYVVMIRNGNTLRLARLEGTSETVITTYTHGSSISTDNWYKIEVYTSGSTIKARFWDVDGEDAPSWQIDTTDASYANTNTGVGVYGYIGNTNDIFYDHLEFRRYDALPNPSPSTLEEKRENVWTSAKDRFVRWDGAIRKDKDTDGEESVSEGYGYFMMEAVNQNDQTTFDLISNFIQNNLIGSINSESWDYLVAWQFDIVGGNVVNDWNYASDGDNDIIYAYLAAHVKWGSAGTVNYKSIADNMEADLYTYTINVQGTYKLQVPYPSELSKTGEIEINPSYFRPSTFEVLHSYYPSRGWNTVLTDGWTMIDGVVAAGVGLIPDWYTYNTTTDAFAADATKSDSHGYESVRCYPFFALAEMVYGDTDADTYIGGDIQTFFEGEIDDHSTIYTEYTHAGADDGSPYEQSYFQWGYALFLEIAGSYDYATFYSNEVSGQYATNTTDATYAYFGSTGYYGGSLNMINASVDDGAFDDISNTTTPTVRDVLFFGGGI